MNQAKHNALELVEYILESCGFCKEVHTLDINRRVGSVVVRVLKLPIEKNQYTGIHIVIAASSANELFASEFPRMIETADKLYKLISETKFTDAECTEIAEYLKCNLKRCAPLLKEVQCNFGTELTRPSKKT